jgi:hypothetical protein
MSGSDLETRLLEERIAARYEWCRYVNLKLELRKARHARVLALVNRIKTRQRTDA